MKNPAVLLEKNSKKKLFIQTSTILRCCGFFLVAEGIAVQLGWALNIPVLKSVIPNVVAMNPMTACAFILSGISIIFLSWESPLKENYCRIAKFLSLFIASVGLLKILNYFFHFQIAVDKLLFREKLLTNQMAPNTAVNLLMIGISIRLIDVETRNRVRPSQFLAIFVLLSSMLAFLGYVCGVKAFYGVASFIPMALNTTICFIPLSLAVLCLRPASALTEVIMSDSTGGLLGRRLLPACIIGPFLLGVASLAGEKAGFYGRDFGLAITIIFNVVLLSGFVWWLSNVLHGIDMERKRVEEIARNLSITDELTGLYNRRGFQTLAEQQLKISKREDNRFMIVFADMDGLKKVNDQYGHHEGDRALIKISEILKKVFRKSDILARFAGDEFAVLAITCNTQADSIILKRLETNLKMFNEARELSYPLALSFGVSYFHGEGTTIEELMNEADKKLYEIKRSKKSRP